MSCWRACRSSGNCMCSMEFICSSCGSRWMLCVMRGCCCGTTGKLASASPSSAAAAAICCASLSSIPDDTERMAPSTGGGLEGPSEGLRLGVGAVGAVDDVSAVVEAGA